MPINCDTVYQTVQALANKEQRGYLTPQEFNLFANQAQMDIFEQYFYDLNAFREAKGMNHQIGDSVNHVMSKLMDIQGLTIDVNEDVTGGVQLPTDKITGRIFYTDPQGRRRTLTQVTNIDEIYDMIGSRWHRAGFDEIVYFEDGMDRIQVWTGTGQLTTGVTCETIEGRPNNVAWGYLVVNEKPIYNVGSSRDFDLHHSEQADVVAKILKLAGISIEDQQLYQAAMAEENLNTQQENK